MKALGSGLVFLSVVMAVTAMRELAGERRIVGSLISVLSWSFLFGGLFLLTTW